MAYQMDFFAADIESKVLAAIESGRVQYPAYVFIRDAEGSATGRLAFVDQNNVLKYVRSENEGKKQVVNVDALPDVAEGDVEVLYIMNGVVYVFDGTEYKAAYKDHTAELEALTERIDSLEAVSGEVANKVAELEAADEAMNEQIVALEEKLNSLEIPEECKCMPDNKYEFTDVPVGTLVDYRDKEIRIMCPADAEFVKQSVGAGGDANSYYGTLKTYAPNDAVGYIEHLNDKVDAEILTDLKTDAYGRKYQPTWLALAKYDDATGWIYYGANSTKEKYIGWDYRIDWYNADGVMIASDSIRINLSNEECHFIIEPYYMASVKAEVEAIKESNADVITQLETITEQVTEFEDRIVEVEKSTLTFVELE